MKEKRVDTNAGGGVGYKPASTHWKKTKFNGLYFGFDSASGHHI